MVIERNPALDREKMKQGVIESAAQLIGKQVAAVVLECTNLISFRQEVQQTLGVPVFDLVSLIELYISGLALKTFQSRFI